MCTLEFSSLGTLLEKFIDCPAAYAQWFGCRALSVLILFGMLFEVSLRLEKVQNSPSKIVVLVDQSRSATLPAASSSYPSRIEVANDFLEGTKDALDNLAKRHEIEFLGFGGRVKTLNADAEIKATQDDTDFLKVLEYLDSGRVKKARRYDSSE